MISIPMLILQNKKSILGLKAAEDRLNDIASSDGIVKLMFVYKNFNPSVLKNALLVHCRSKSKSIVLSKSRLVVIE